MNIAENVIIGEILITPECAEQAENSTIVEHSGSIVTNHS